MDPTCHEPPSHSKTEQYCRRATELQLLVSLPGQIQQQQQQQQWPLLSVAPGHLVWIDRGPISLKLCLLVEHSYKEATALSVMWQNAHAALNVHGLDVLLREHAWHQLVMGLLQVINSLVSLKVLQEVHLDMLAADASSSLLELPSHTNRPPGSHL